MVLNNYISYNRRHLIFYSRITSYNVCYTKLLRDTALEESIKDISGVIKTEILDDLLSVWVEDTEKVSRELLYLLSKSSSYVSSFSVRSKNLEDIFLEEVKGK